MTFGVRISSSTNSSKWPPKIPRNDVFSANSCSVPKLATLPSTASVPPEQVAKSVTEYCAEAAGNIDTFTEGEWQDLLRTVVKSIIFDGADVGICGRIPIPGASGVEAPITIKASVHHAIDFGKVEAL